MNRVKKNGMIYYVQDSNDVYISVHANESSAAIITFDHKFTPGGDEIILVSNIHETPTQDARVLKDWLRSHIEELKDIYSVADPSDTYNPVARVCRATIKLLVNPESWLNAEFFRDFDIEEIEEFDFEALKKRFHTHLKDDRETCGIKSPSEEISRKMLNFGKPIEGDPSPLQYALANLASKKFFNGHPWRWMENC